MIDGYPNIEYDEQTRRVNRRMKFLGAAVCILVVAGLAIAIANTDLSSPAKATVSNDTDGTVTCVAVYRLDRPGGEDLRMSESGRFEARDGGSVVYGSSCSVFDRDGNYVSCLRIRHRSDAGDEQFLASTGERRVKADACVYPR